MPMQYRAALLTLGFVMTGACSLIDPVPTCTDEARAALVVEVRDSLTNAPAGQGARIIARTGSFADTVQTVESFSSYGLAHERPGTYTLTVEQEGYKPWSRSGIEVSPGECHVRTVNVTVRLQR